MRITGALHTVTAHERHTVTAHERHTDALLRHVVYNLIIAPGARKTCYKQNMTEERMCVGGFARGLTFAQPTEVVSRITSSIY